MTPSGGNGVSAPRGPLRGAGLSFPPMASCCEQLAREADFFISLLELVQAHRVAVEQLLTLDLRDAFHRSVDEPPRLGVGRRRVGKVRLPHDVVQADLVSLLDANRLVPEVDMNLT